MLSPELEGAMKFFTQVVDRGGRVTLGALRAPPADFGSALGAFEQTLEHEREVTAMIDRLYAMAVKQATEQVQALSTLGGDAASLLMLDRELGSRQAGAA